MFEFANGLEILLMTIFLSHRGESDDEPENTMAAFELATKRDSDGIELDIRLTADGELVCVHDKTLKRVSGTDLAVASSTLSELRRYHPVPLLSEALDCLTVGMHMQIELKGTPILIQPLKKVLDNWTGDCSCLSISSFEQETIRLAADIFPDQRRIILIDLNKYFSCFPEAEQVIKLLYSLRCTGISFLATKEACSLFVDELKQAGFRVVCWGISSDELGLAMANIGVDAMTCNHAVALREKWLAASGSS